MVFVQIFLAVTYVVLLWALGIVLSQLFALIIKLELEYFSGRPAGDRSFAEPIEMLFARPSRWQRVVAKVGFVLFAPAIAALLLVVAVAMGVPTVARMGLRSFLLWVTE